MSKDKCHVEKAPCPGSFKKRAAEAEINTGPWGNDGADTPPQVDDAEAPRSACSDGFLPPQKEDEWHGSRLMHILPILLKGKKENDKCDINAFPSRERGSFKGKDFKASGYSRLIKQATFRSGKRAGA